MNQKLIFCNDSLWLFIFYGFRKAAALHILRNPSLRRNHFATGESPANKKECGQQIAWTAALERCGRPYYLGQCELERPSSDRHAAFDLQAIRCISAPIRRLVIYKLGESIKACFVTEPFANFLAKRQ